MIQIVKATEKDIATIRSLAHAIWYPTYLPILSKAQIDLMLSDLYSEEKLRISILGKAEFYLLRDDQEELGFMALEAQEEVLRIDKIYLLPETQGLGYGKKLLDFAATKAVSRGLNQLELNVNRNNKAYYFYLKQGFEVVATVDMPYYQFVLDDYIMRKQLIS